MKNLYRAPFELIETCRAQMLLITTSRKLTQLPQSDILVQRLQEEYETLLQKINEFSQAKKNNGWKPGKLQ